MKIDYRVFPEHGRVAGKAVTTLKTTYRASATCHDGDTFDEGKGKEIVELKIKRKQAAMSLASRKAKIRCYKAQMEYAKALQENIDVLTRKAEKLTKEIESYNEKLKELGG